MFYVRASNRFKGHLRRLSNLLERMTFEEARELPEMSLECVQGCSRASSYRTSSHCNPAAWCRTQCHAVHTQCPAVPALQGGHPASRSPWAGAVCGARGGRPPPGEARLSHPPEGGARIRRHAPPHPPWHCVGGWPALGAKPVPLVAWETGTLLGGCLAADSAPPSDSHL